MDRDVALLAALAVHLAAAAVHGATHGLVPVPLPAWANALVLGTVVVGPVAGVALARRGHPVGVPLFTASMTAAFLLGLALHFSVETPDRIDLVPAGPWRLHFQASAVGVAAVQALGIAVGAWHLRTA